jgi:hypothetical protein
MERVGLKSIGINYLLGLTNLKRELLYFDRLAFDKKELYWSNEFAEPVGKTFLKDFEIKETIKLRNNELEFLQDKNLIFSFDSNELEKITYKKKIKSFTDYFDEHKTHKILFSFNDVLNLSSIFSEISNLMQGTDQNRETIYKIYFASLLLNTIYEVESVPLVNKFIPEKEFNIGKEQKILEIVIDKFPIIDDSVSWDQILDFKNDEDSKRKFLALRNWMIDISKGNFSATELSEKIDYLYSQYVDHIARHKLKTNMGTIKSFAITTSEILEDLIRIKWSKAVRTTFELFERDSILADIEANAPGKEVAYICSLNEQLIENNHR